MILVLFLTLGWGAPSQASAAPLSALTVCRALLERPSGWMGALEKARHQADVIFSDTAEEASLKRLRRTLEDSVLHSARELQKLDRESTITEKSFHEATEKILNQYANVLWKEVLKLRKFNERHPERVTRFLLSVIGAQRTSGDFFSSSFLNSGVYAFFEQYGRWSDFETSARKVALSELQLLANSANSPEAYQEYVQAIGYALSSAVSHPSSSFFGLANKILDELDADLKLELGSKIKASEKKTAFIQALVLARMKMKEAEYYLELRSVGGGGQIQDQRVYLRLALTELEDFMIASGIPF